MEEIIKKLDEVDLLIREKMRLISSNSIKSACDVHQIGSLKQARDKIQDAISSILLAEIM